MAFDLDVAIHGVPYYTERGWRDKGRQRASTSLNFGEDAWALRVRQNEPSILIGVADGVSAWSNEGYNPAIVSAEMLRAAVEEGELSLDLRTNLRRAQERVKAEGIVGAGTCTVTILKVSPVTGTLSALILGDSFPGIWRSNTGFKWLVSPVSGRSPAGVPNQIGVVPEELAREKFYIAGEASEAEVIENVPLEAGTVIVVGTDGLWDNLIPPGRKGVPIRNEADIASLWEERAHLVDAKIREALSLAANSAPPCPSSSPSDCARHTAPSPAAAFARALINSSAPPPEAAAQQQQGTRPLTPPQQYRQLLHRHHMHTQQQQQKQQQQERQQVTSTATATLGGAGSTEEHQQGSSGSGGGANHEHTGNNSISSQLKRSSTTGASAAPRRPSLAETVANVLMQEAKRGMVDGGKPDDVTCCVCICLPRGLGASGNSSTASANNSNGQKSDVIL